MRHKFEKSHFKNIDFESVSILTYDLNLFLLTFYFILEYSRLTIVCDSFRYTAK